MRCRSRTTCWHGASIRPPNQAWVSDITYIRTRSGWLYLAVVLDLYTRKGVGWAMAPTMHAEFWCAWRCSWPSRSANQHQG